MARVVEELYEQIQLSEDEEKQVGGYFFEEIRKALASRIELERRWERAYRLYEGIRPRKDFPWRGASNINIPLVAIHASAIHARFMTSLFTPEPFWRVKSKNPDYQDFATAATEYLDWSQGNEFPFYEAVRDWAWDSIKVGLGVLKVTWKKRRGKQLRYEEVPKKSGVMGKIGAMFGATELKVVEDEVDIDDHPDVESIPTHHFVWPNGYHNVQTAPWVCHRMRLSPAQVEALYDQGWLHKGKDRIIGAETTIRDRIDIVKDEMMGYWPTAYQNIELYEIWAKYKIGNRSEGELQIVMEPLTQTICRINPNPYFHRKRPFVIGRLEVREHAIPGFGVGDQIGDLNDELNTVHNQTVDATTTATVQMFKVRAGSPAEASIDQIWPGKKIPVSQQDDVTELAMGTLTTTSFPLEQQVQSYAERRTGISDFNLGREPLPSRRGTATGTMAIIQEGNKKFDYQIRDMRSGLSEVGMMLLSMMQQNNPDGVVKEVLGKDGDSFQQIKLIFPTIPLSAAVTVDVVAGTAAVNRQVQRQDAITLYQLMMSFYQQAFQFGQLLSQPGIPPTLAQLGLELAHGGEVLMKEVLNAFENRRGDELVPSLEDIYAQLAASGVAQGIAGAPGMGGAPAGVPGAGAPGPGAGGFNPTLLGGAGVQGGGPKGQGGAGNLG